MKILKQWRLSEQQKHRATAMYESGMSLGKVATEFSVSRQSMWDVLKRRTKMRDRIAALPRKSPTAKRIKRLRTLRRYRARAKRITRAQVRAVMERDKICRMCGQPGTDIDHVIPVSKGGQTDLLNLQLLCRTCHRQKSGNFLRKEVPMEVSVSGQSTLFAEASRDHVRTSPRRAKVQASKVNAQDYGASTPVLLAKFNRASSSWRTSQLCLDGGLSVFSETWPRSGTMRNGIAYQLQPLVPLTGATVSGSWPTPRASAIAAAATMETVANIKNPRGNLEEAIFASIWPTPTSMDYKDGTAPRFRNGELQTDTLGRAIGGHVNPTWVEWLMGFPLGWTALEPLVTQ